MSFNESPDLAMTGASQAVSSPTGGEAPNDTMQLLQRLARNLQEYLPRTDETAQQVSSLVTHQTTVDGDLAALRDRTTGLLGAVNVLDDRTVHISTSLGNLSQATASSQEHIRELARVLNEMQGGADIAINNLITQVRAELTPLIQAMDAHPQTSTVPAISRSDNTATTQEVPTPSTSSPSDPLKASGESGKATAEYAFHLRTRIGDCPKYNGDRTNDAAYFWTTEAYLWLDKYQTLTRAKISEEQALALFSDALEDKASKWWMQKRKGAILLGDSTPSTIEGFFTAVRTEFQELNAEDKRRQRYEKVQQTGSVQGYITAFKDRLMYLDPRPSDYEILRQFKKGLNEKIKFEISTRHPSVTGLMEYWTLADFIDRVFKEAGVENTSSRTRFRPTPYLGSTSSRPRPEEGVKRLNYIASSMPNIKKDPKLFKTWCLANRACFTCGSKDHRSSSCSKTPRIPKEASRSEN
jgi:hypothetical protein